MQKYHVKKLISSFPVIKEMLYENIPIKHMLTIKLVHSSFKLQSLNNLTQVGQGWCHQFLIETSSVHEN